MDLRSVNLDSLVEQIKNYLSNLEDQPFEVVEAQDASYCIRITPDMLKVYLDLYPPLGSGLPLNPEDVVNALQQEGIPINSYDMIYERIKKCNESDICYENDLLIAEGTPPTPPTPGKIEFLQPIERVRRYDEDDPAAIDWKKLWELPTVDEGEEFALISPPHSGTHGIDIYGREIPPEPVEVLRYSLLDGVRGEIDDSGIIHVFATRSGQPFFDGVNFDVLPILNIPGNVDLQTGDIDFKGSIVIQGIINEGFSVRCSGDLVICNGIYNGRINSLGQCIVRNGIVGENCVVRAKGIVQAGYVEYATVISAEDIEIAGYSLFSTLKAKNKIIVKGKRYRGIIGGTAHAGSGIDTISVGSVMEPYTYLQVGVDPILVEERERKDKKIEELLWFRNRIEQAILSFTSNDTSFDIENLSEKERQKLFMLIRQMKRLEETAEQLKVSVAEISKVLDSERQHNPRIKVRNVIYPNVTIGIWESVFKIQKIDSYCSFFYNRQRREVVRGSY